MPPAPGRGRAAWLVLFLTTAPLLFYGVKKTSHDFFPKCPAPPPTPAKTPHLPPIRAFTLACGRALAPCTEPFPDPSAAWSRHRATAGRPDLVQGLPAPTDANKVNSGVQPTTGCVCDALCFNRQLATPLARPLAASMKSTSWQEDLQRIRQLRLFQNVAASSLQLLLKEFQARDLSAGEALLSPFNRNQYP